MNLNFPPFKEVFGSQYDHHPVYLWSTERSVIWFIIWPFCFLYYLIRAIIRGLYNEFAKLINDEWK